MYDLMQGMHPKTLSCSVIVKGRKDSGDKFKLLSDAIDAMHNDVGSGAKSDVFPLD
jgi:hypothetical protein